MSDDYSRRIEAAGRRRAATRPSAQQKRPVLAPFDQGVYFGSREARRHAEALPVHIRPRFIAAARAIASGEAPTERDLLAIESPRLIAWRSGVNSSFAVLTDLGADVALALVDQAEADLRAREFGTLFPRHQVRALMRGPCPVCARPIIFDTLAVCAQCWRLIPYTIQREATDAAGAALYAPQSWSAGSRRDSAWLRYRTAAMACVIAARLRLAE